MKFIITGANGFIGSYLSRYLLRQGHQVLAISRRFSPGVKEQLSGATFIEHDILQPDFVKIETQSDLLVHLASANDILSKNVHECLELSALGTLNTLKFAVNNGIGKFIFYSTLQVYGTELKGTYSENSEVKPENDYAIHHLFGELYAEMYSRKSDMNVLVVRPSNIYGQFVSRDINRWSLVPGCFCKEAVEQGKITLLSSGKQTRNFISLELVSVATERAATNMRKKFDVLNFVSHDYYSIFDMAVIVKEVLKQDFRIGVDITVMSEHPITGNVFRLSHDKLLSYGIDMNSSGITSINVEIKGIIDLLIKPKR